MSEIPSRLNFVLRGEQEAVSAANEAAERMREATAKIKAAQDSCEEAVDLVREAEQEVSGLDRRMAEVAQELEREVLKATTAALSARMG